MSASLSKKYVLMGCEAILGFVCRPGGTSGLETSSGADLNLIDAYLQQLLPALAKATHGAPSKGGNDL